MEQKNSLIITKNNLETITKYCELNQLENLNFFMNDCLKKGLRSEEHTSELQSH